MAIDMEFAERYFGTWLDFFRFRPYKFFGTLEKDPTKYLSALRYITATVIVLSAVWTVTFSFYSTLSPAVSKAYPDLALQLDAKVRIARQAFFFVFIIGVSVLGIRFLLWWPLKWKSTVLDVLKAQAYVLSLAVVLAAIEAAVTPLVIWIGLLTNLRIAIVILAACLVAIFMPLSIYYTYTALSACTGLRRRRFLESSLVLGGLVGAITGTIYSIVIAVYMVRESGILLDHDPEEWGFAYVPPIIYGFLIWLCLRWAKSLARRAQRDPDIITSRIQKMLSTAARD